MRKALKILCLLCALSLGLCACSFAEEEGFIKRMWRKITQREAKEETQIKVPQEELEVPEEAEPTPELTREEVITILKDYFYVLGEALTSRVPGVVRKVDEEGNAIYLFQDKSGNEIAFEDLDEETLDNLFRRVGTQVSIIRAEQIHMQIQQQQYQMRQMQGQRQMQQQQQQIQQVPRPPQMPQPPQSITQPHQPPKVYTPPPRPPSVPRR